MISGIFIKVISETGRLSVLKTLTVLQIIIFLPESNPEKADVLFFAGCMTHLTPAIKNSMIKILDASGVNYNFIDEEGGVCCGRPLMLAGQDKEARELINL